MRLPFSRIFERRRDRRISQVMAVLSNGEGHFVVPLMQATGISSAGVYIALARLEARGVVVSGWADPVRPDVPRRRWYRLADHPAVGGATQSPSNSSSDLDGDAA